MGRKKLNIVHLNEQEREELRQYLRKGKSSARSLTRARILLLADDGRDDEAIAETLRAWAIKSVIREWLTFFADKDTVYKQIKK